MAGRVEVTMLQNEYKFDTEENREFSIRHIAELVAMGYVIVSIEDDDSKTLVAFEEPESA